MTLAARLETLVVTDEGAAGARGVIGTVRAALDGGATAVQMRGKGASTRQLIELGTALREETRRAGALLFVNDRVDVALAIAADGAHLGDDDLPLSAARAITPPHFLLGRSVDTPDEARTAELQGADYVGAGPFALTLSKAVGPALGESGLREIIRAVTIPVVAIGGIDASNATAAARAGATGVAVIRAIMAAQDPAGAARALRSAFHAGRARP